MKRIIILSTVFITLSLHAISQAAGNVLYNQDRNNRRSNYTPGEVDLSLENYNYDFSSTILEANVIINVPATAYIAIFSLTQTGKTIEETDSAMAARLGIFERMLARVN